MKRLFSSWQGFAAGLAAVGLYVAAPPVLRLLDPTAGVFDAGFLHWVILATVIYFWGIFVTWVGWQIAFRSMDRWADGHLRAAFDSLPDFIKLLAVQITFALMWVSWLVVLKIVPV